MCVHNFNAFFYVSFVILEERSIILAVCVVPSVSQSVKLFILK